MNERFYLRFIEDGNPLAVIDVDDAGIMFDEADPRRRRLVMDFEPRGAVTTFRVSAIRRLRDWDDWHFELVPLLEDGKLGFRGVDEGALPHGLYSARPRIEGVKVRVTRPDFAIEPGGSATIDVRVARDRRRVECKLDDCDDAIGRVLEAPGPVNGASLGDWLIQSDARATRKACALNVLALLRSFPTKSDPLIPHVKRLFVVKDDRLYAEVGPDMLGRVDALARDLENRKFWPETKVTAEIHRLLLTALPPPDDSADYKLRSYRGEGPVGMQIVFAVPPDGHAPRYYAEVDVDLGNPLQDVAGFAIHMGELVDNRPTDHLDLWKKLVKKPAKEFLYYSVKNA